ncbi:uncharacterized protein [Anabrus simplex]|uniref:uncharacterized protein n=1 Tax=Anabrus simplex TaxID=316456 RepID=UPI0035A2C032
MSIRTFRWMYKNSCLFFLTLLFCAVALGGYIGLEWLLVDPLRMTSRSIDASVEENVDFRRDIASQLADLGRELKSSVSQANPDVLLKLNKIISQLDPRYALSSGTILASEPQPIPDTCGEEYINTTYGQPFFEKGFVVKSSCQVDQKPPLESLLTILLLDGDGDLTKLKTILEGVNKYYTNVPVSLATAAPVEEVKSIISEFNHIQAFTITNFDVNRPGKTWNRLIKTVKTPYVLLARDIFHFNSLARLERQIFVISNTSVIGVAGGAFRNESGYWKIGCHMSVIKNYFLKYTEGYHYSAMDCMFCDYIEGPFIVRVKTMQNVKLKDELSRDVVFVDWFLRVKQEGILVMACPDVMYFKQGLVENEHKSKTDRAAHESWLAFAKEWEVNRIISPSQVPFRFTCEELQLTCDATRWSKALLIPPCCIDQVAGALKALDDFSKEKGIDYEIEAGTLLGAVKLSGFLPWDRDGDITFQTKDYDTFYENSNSFSEKGFSLAMFKRASYFHLNTPDITLEMWGSDQLSTFQLPSEMWEIPTRIKFLGMWVRGEWNPGLFARNRYGPGYLQHVQHWRLLGMHDSWVTYRPGSWISCPKKAHHGCLDQYPTDGNIGYSYQETCLEI